MTDLLEQLAFCAAGVGIMWLIGWGVDHHERKKSQEQRKADEQWEWRHTR